MLDSAPFPAAEVLTRRLVEVELHHCDLAVGYGPADWPTAFAAMELTEPMRSQRRDRLRYPPPGARPVFPGRPVAPWKPGQRLPGSWLGTGNQGTALPALLWNVTFPGDLVRAACAISGDSSPTRQEWYADIQSEPFEKTCPYDTHRKCRGY